jgi:tetratricopeptide (TPR) repeat protein
MQADACVTLTGDVVGTLRYMSPEQADGQTALVDARTDVYSLGATLYELMTQRPAFPSEDRQRLLRQVVAEEPMPPRRLNPAVPVDLETIVLTAMAKSRQERYPSARALAEDLENFLAGRPLRVRRPTLADRARKWARRHRSLVAVVASAMILLTVTLAVSVVLLAREQARTSAALTQEQRHFRQARLAVDQFGLRLVDRLSEVPGAESVQRDLLADVLRYYRQFMSEENNNPQLRHDLALAHFKSGVIAAKLGAGADAIAEYQAAQKLLAELAATVPEEARTQAQLAMTRNNLGLSLAARGDVDAARTEYAGAIAIQRRLVEAYPADASFGRQLAESQSNLGMLLDQVGDTQQAEGLLRAAIDNLRPLAQSLGDELESSRKLAITCNNLSYVLRKRNVNAAENAAHEALAVLKPLAQRHPTHLEYQDDLALCYHNIAALESAQGRLSNAINWHGEAILLQERLVRKSPAVVRHRSDLATSLNNLGVAYSRLNQPSEADAVFARARELLAILADDYPDDPAYRRSLGALLNNQALALASAGRHDVAMGIYRTAIKLERACSRRQGESATSRETLSKIYSNFGQSLRMAGRLRESADTALARRDLWQGNGEKLLAIALELAEICRQRVDGSDPSFSEAVLRSLEDEVVATLRMAHECGWPGKTNLATDERFACLNCNERFAAFIAQLTPRATEARAKKPDGSDEPSHAKD